MPKRTKRWGGGPAMLVLTNQDTGDAYETMDVGHLTEDDYRRLTEIAGRIGLRLQLIDDPLKLSDDLDVEHIINTYRPDAE